MRSNPVEDSTGKIHSLFQGIGKPIFLVLLALFLIVVVGLVAFRYVSDKPFGNPNSPSVQIAISPGMNLPSLSSLLEDKGLIKKAETLVFLYKVISKFSPTPLQYLAGRYELNYGLRPSRIIRELTNPQSRQRVYVKLTVPPGFTVSRIAERVEKKGLANSEDFKQAVIDLASEYPILPNSNGLQGYLYPDTYKIEPPLEESNESSQKTARVVVKLMADNFFNILDSLNPGWKNLTPVQLHEKIILASIVEKEYRVPEEASRISAVFNNRLSLNMNLQSCATVVYVIEDTDVGISYRKNYLKFKRRIFEQYLEIKSSYNTYLNSGLPPNPIAVPGRTALQAAFFPADTTALFFVVKDPVAGTHNFTENYKDHLRAQKIYLENFIVKD